MNQEREGPGLAGRLWFAFLVLVTILSWATDSPEVDRLWWWAMVTGVILPGTIVIGGAVIVFFGFLVGYREGMPPLDQEEAENNDRRRV